MLYLITVTKHLYNYAWSSCVSQSEIKVNSKELLHGSLSVPSGSRAKLVSIVIFSFNIRLIVRSEQKKMNASRYTLKNSTSFFSLRDAMVVYQASAVRFSSN